MRDTHPRVPAVAAACALALGTAVAGALASLADAASISRFVRVVLPVAVALSGPAAIFLGGSFRGHARPGLRISHRTELTADVMLLAALAVAGGLHHTVHRGMVPRDHVSVASEAGRVTLCARVAEVRGSSSGGVNVIVNALELRDAATPDSSTVPMSGLVWVRWPEDAAVPAAGDEVVLEGALEAPRGRRNPGAFDFAAWLRDRGVRRTLRRCGVVSHATDRRRANPAAWVEHTIRRRVPGLPGELLTGLLLGRARELPDELTEAFRRSGTVHVLAVSGLHVGFIVLIVHALLRSLRVPRRLSRALVVPALLCFVAVVGPRPSVLRASTMAAFLVAAPLLERKPNPLNSLGAAALVLMVARPGSLFDVGFRLSFSAVGGILLMHEPISRRLSEALASAGSRTRRVATPIATTVALSLAAQAGVAPVLIRGFGTVSLVAPLANLAAVPLAGLSVASGLAVLATEPVGGWVASAFAAVAWSSCRALIVLTEHAGRPGWASVRVAVRFWPATLLGVLGLCTLLRSQGRRGRRSGVALLTAALAVTLACGLTGPGRTHARVVFFDVGQGDSVLLELPGRECVLVDAGPGPGRPWSDSDDRFSTRWIGRDTGADVVVPYLQREAISRLRALVVTHAHADHFGGAAAVLGSVRVDTLVLPLGRRDDPRLAGLVDYALALGTPVVEVGRGRVLTVGETRLHVVSPEGIAARRSSENDASVVLRAGIEERTVLLTGDIERAAENRLRAADPDLSADLLKVAHHGSATSSSPAFLRCVRPALAVIQVGEGNRHGHPDRATLLELERTGAATCRTDLDGAVVVTVRGGVMTVSCVASGRRLVLRPGRVDSGLVGERHIVGLDGAHNGQREALGVDDPLRGRQHFVARHR